MPLLMREWILKGKIYSKRKSQKISRNVQNPTPQGVQIDRDEWLTEARGTIQTSRAIYVHATTVLYLCGSGYVILRKNNGMLRV